MSGGSSHSRPVSKSSSSLLSSFHHLPQQPDCDRLPVHVTPSSGTVSPSLYRRHSPCTPAALHWSASSSSVERLSQAAAASAAVGDRHRTLTQLLPAADYQLHNHQLTAATGLSAGAQTVQSASDVTTVLL